jgi:putative transposase
MRHRVMIDLFLVLLGALRSAFRSRASLALEDLALRQQLVNLRRTSGRPRIRKSDRAFWLVLCRLWSRWADVLVVVKPDTVVRWNRAGFRDIGERSVSRFMPPQPREPPSQTWRTFLDNHVGSLASIDFFTVPAATFRVLYVFFVLAHDRRRVLHFNVTELPSAPWTGQQIIEAFPEDTAPGYMIRDRDQIYGDQFRRRVGGIGIDEVLTAPRSPWQNPYAERLVGSVRRECLDHVIVLGEQPSMGKVVALPEVGGLHHRYERIAA